MIQITVLDGKPLNPGDLSWAGLEELAFTKIYDQTLPEDVVKRSRQADILVVNKVVIDEKIMAQLHRLKCICVSATGYNNVDVKAAKARNIKVFNVVGYSNASVAQYVFAAILNCSNQLEKHGESVRQGDWQNSAFWCYWNHPIVELAGKTIGIVGLGKIGNKVADIALAFGMKVIAHHKHPARDARPGVLFTDLHTVFRESDFLTLHCPLTEDNLGFVDQKHLAMMKPTALLINTARGPLVREADLKFALENKLLAGAVLDVLTEEPPVSGNALIGVKNCIVTPHQAWASRESRERLMAGVVENIHAFFNGNPGNVV